MVGSLLVKCLERRVARGVTKRNRVLSSNIPQSQMVTCADHNGVSAA